MILGDMSYALLMSKDYDRAAVRCAELLEANPENMDGHFYMGSIYISKGNYRKSIRHYMEYIRLSEPGKRPPSKFVALITDTYGSQAQAWNNIGNCHANLREFDRAALAFQKAISHDGEIALYYENYAYSLLDLGNPDKAAEVLENAVGLGIATRSIHQKLSNIYRSQEKLDKAVEHLRKALEMDTSDVSYCINLGELLILQSQRVPESSPGLLEEAEATLHKALGLESGHPLVLHHLARINSLLSALSAGNNGKADRDDKVSRYIDEIMELDDIGSGQYMQMGNDWIAIERYDRAIMFYEKCLESGPGNCDVLINLANCYAKMGMYESAFTGYQAALAMRPNDPTVIGNLLAMKNDINQAITSSV